MSGLPDGWAEIEIGQLMQVVSGGTPPSKDESNFSSEGGIPWLTPADLSGYPEKYIARGARNLSEKGYAACSATKMPAGSVLFSSRAPVGYVAVAANEMSTNQGFKSFIPPDGFSSVYLYYYLKHIKPVAEQMATGTTFKELSGAAAAKLPLLVAPLPEQKRIADKLDSVLARVDACCDRLDRIPALLKRFRQSVLAAAMSGRLTEEWRAEHLPPNMATAIDALPSDQKARRGVTASVVPASEFVDSWNCPDGWWRGTAAALLCKGVLVDLKDGNHGVNHPVVSDFTPEGLPFVTAAQVDRFRIDYAGAYKLSGEPLAKLRVGFAKPGDVVLTHKGTVGRLAIVDRECVLTPQTTYYRVNRLYAAPEFLMCYMASQPFCAQLDEIKSQTTRDFVPITQQYALVHLIPSLSEQQEIVRRVETLFAFADRVEARCAAARKQAGQLTPALLAKAFRGELVPQDPADEPAAELLKRLAARRAEAPKTRRGRKPVAARE